MWPISIFFIPNSNYFSTFPIYKFDMSMYMYVRTNTIKNIGKHLTSADDIWKLTTNRFVWQNGQC